MTNMTIKQEITTPPLNEQQNDYIKAAEEDVTWMLENGFSLKHTRGYMFTHYGRVLSDDLRRIILNSAVLIANNPSSPIVFR